MSPTAASVSQRLVFIFHREYSYARRFWTRHLLHVPPGNREIFDSLKGFDNLTLNHKLTADDILTLEAWLKVCAHCFGVVVVG